MSQLAYALPNKPYIVTHSDSNHWWLGDYAAGNEADDSNIREFTAADAVAASGDCFVTLATRIDKVAQGLPRDSAEQIELEYLVSELFYLQDHWDVVAKRRQR